MISKSATDKRNCVLNAHFTKNARAAWGHVIASVCGGKSGRVLLPGYIGYTAREGSGVHDPVVANGAEFDFYKIKGDLSVDMEDLARQLAKGFDIVLVIHYFGFCRNDLDALAQLCRDVGAVLVEDCAHAFYLDAPGSRIGDVGEFAFYSLHKYLALDTGGLLKVNSKDRSIMPIPAEIEADRDVLAQYALSDFSAISSRRRQNYEAYVQLLEGLQNHIEIMYVLEDADIPQSFAIRVKHGKREPLYFHLMSKGMTMIALYYRMIDQLRCEEHALAVEISSQILNLPVHQDTNLEDVYAICREIRAYFEGQGAK
ncbi:DegT/DnrJ/EryC1/StrS family aminotransferase [Massilia rhizosphaerae]|uniref:DegT/DnrJ/EryC1/StrS family aminotransferase n=1 Tax=Massilia rhizosphaerae TaxID=2784389 RepID=UPI0018DB89F2|nr:DegT/DnrJ/EryC1/StrS family aminotransferase [Massilia rhizosphaerae]